jgi:hypothetical protein
MNTAQRNKNREHKPAGGRQAAGAKIMFLCLFLIVNCSLVIAQSVYVEDFTATQEDIRPLMTGATDVVRSALLQNTVAEFVESPDSAAWVISGTVTRFGAVKPPDKGGNFSGSVNVAISLFNFIAPILQTGHIASQNNRGRADPEAEPRVMVSAHLTEARTGRVAAAGTISAVTWEDYLTKAADLARGLGRALPFPETAFSGAWEAVIEHSSGWEDSYRVNFRAGGQCGIAVTSAGPAGGVSSQTADGRYTWNGEILTVTARFRDNAVAHLRTIDWRAIAVLAADRRSFTMTIPVSSQSGAERLRAQFWKE